MRAYGSDPFAYDLGAALVASSKKAGRLAIVRDAERRAEEQCAIRLPVVAPSRTTGVRENESAILLDELPPPLPSKLARHRAVYGSEGLEHWPEDTPTPKLRSKRSRRRGPSRGEVSKAA
jgi:hypothetical protein